MVLLVVGILLLKVWFMLLLIKKILKLWYKDAEKIQHAEELYYVFLNRSLSEISEPDALTHQRLVRLWSNFIKFGWVLKNNVKNDNNVNHNRDPTPEVDDLLENITWPAATPTNYVYLNINNSLTIEVNPKEEYFSKWENVFDTYGQRPFSTY